MSDIQSRDVKDDVSASNDPPGEQRAENAATDQAQTPSPVAKQGAAAPAAPPAPKPPAPADETPPTKDTAPAWDVKAVQERARRLWPVIAMVLAALLWWPTGFGGRASWMQLPFTAGPQGAGFKSGDAILLGSLAAAAIVAALVASAWPRSGIAVGLTAVAWLGSEAGVTFLAHERLTLIGLAAIGLWLGLWVGGRARSGSAGWATALAMIAGLSPATWSRGLIVAVAVALPLWVASKDRVAPTVVSILKVVAVWLLSVLVALSLRAGFAAVPRGGLGDIDGAGRTVASGVWTYARTNWKTVIESSVTTFTSWIWLAVVIGIGIVVARIALARYRAYAAARAA